jgi:hypothetical protein
MSNVQPIRPEAALRAIEQARVQGDNSRHQPPGGGNGEPPLEARVLKLEDFAQETRDRLTRIETRLESTATKADLFSSEGSIRSEMHKAIGEQTWRLMGAMVTFGTLLSGAVFFIARNVK